MSLTQREHPAGKEEGAVAFPSGMGTPGLRRRGVGSGVLCEGLAGKEANCGEVGGG